MIINYGCTTSIMYILLTTCTVEECTFLNNISNNSYRLYFVLFFQFERCFVVMFLCGILWNPGSIAKQDI